VSQAAQAVWLGRLSFPRSGAHPARSFDEDQAHHFSSCLGCELRQLSLPFGQRIDGDDSSLCLDVRDVEFEVVEAGSGYHPDVRAACRNVEVTLRRRLVDRPSQILGRHDITLRPQYDQWEHCKGRLLQALVQGGGRVTLTPRSEHNVTGAHEIAVCKVFQLDAGEALRIDEAIGGDVPQLDC
jgi:hypothetical protein